MKQVFISYSWKDEAIAMRLYKDLKHQNINIWLDRIDGEPTGDFKSEFLRLIDQCRYFIVIDSDNYRRNSNWCETELNACFRRIDNRENVTLIVCLAEASGIWRDTDLIENPQTRLLYDRLNKQKHFNLFHEGVYDNHSNYLRTIEALCRILGKDTFPWDFFPEELDLIDELNASARYYKICEDDREALLCLVKTIAYRRRALRDIKSHLEQLIFDCKELEVQAFLPEWLYAIWLADKRHGGKYDVECLDCLKSLSNRFPEDSRVYRGLGGINARLDRQEEAKYNFLKAYRLLRSDQIEIRYEVLCNLSQVYMNMKCYAEAKYTIEDAMSLSNDCEVNVSLALNYFECLTFLNRKKEADCFIGYLADNYPIAEFNSCYGCSKMEQKDYMSAKKYLEKAYRLKPDLENTFFLLRCLYSVGDNVAYRKILSSISGSLSTDEDKIFWMNEIAKLPSFIR